MVLQGEQLCSSRGRAGGRGPRKRTRNCCLVAASSAMSALSSSRRSCQFSTQEIGNLRECIDDQLNILFMDPADVARPCPNVWPAPHRLSQRFTEQHQSVWGAMPLTCKPSRESRSAWTSLAAADMATALPLLPATASAAPPAAARAPAASPAAAAAEPAPELAAGADDATGDCAAAVLSAGSPAVVPAAASGAAIAGTEAAPPPPAAGLASSSAMRPCTSRTAVCRFGNIGLSSRFIGTAVIRNLSFPKLEYIFGPHLGVFLRGARLVQELQSQAGLVVQLRQPAHRRLLALWWNAVNGSTQPAQQSVSGNSTHVDNGVVHLLRRTARAPACQAGA